MAKIEDDLDIDGLDDLDDFNFDDLDLDIPDGTDDRSPVKKLSSGFAQGAVDHLTSVSDLPRKLKKVLPEEYSTSVDTIESGLSTGVKLYDTVRKETSQGIKDFKRAAGKMVAINKGKLPKGIADRLEKWTTVEDKDRKAELSKEALREQEIQQQLAETLGVQVEQQNTQYQEARAESTVRELAGITRHKDQLGELFAIRQTIERQVSFQDQVTARYQRKSLELQYRQFHLATDLLSIQQQHSKDVKEALQSVVKNTALPEYQKIELNEAAGQMLRDRLIGGLQNKASKFVGNFTDNFSANVVKRVKEKSAEFGSTLSDISGGLDMAAENAGVLDPLSMVGSAVGEKVAKAGGDGLLGKIAKTIADNETASKWLLKAHTKISDAPRSLNEWAGEDQGYGLLGGIKSLIAESIPRHYLDHSVKARDSLDQADRATIFDNQTKRSITEIIPGFLSRILGEVSSIRSGMGFTPADPDSRVDYDYQRGNFTTVKDSRLKLATDIFDESTLKRASASSNKLLNAIDQNSELSPGATFALSKYLMNTNLNAKTFDIKKMADSNNLSGMANEHAKEISSFFTKKFGVEQTEDESFNSVVSFDESIQNLKEIQKLKELFNDTLRDLPDVKTIMEAYTSLGRGEDLENLGFTKTEGTSTIVNYDKIFELYHSGSHDHQLEDSDITRLKAESAASVKQEAEAKALEQAEAAKLKAKQRRANKETFEGKVTNNIKGRIGRLGSKVKRHSGYQTLKNAKQRVEDSVVKGFGSALDYTTDSDYRAEVNAKLQNGGLGPWSEDIYRRFKNRVDGGGKLSERATRYLSELYRTAYENGVDITPKDLLLDETYAGVSTRPEILAEIKAFAREKFASVRKDTTPDPTGARVPTVNKHGQIFKGGFAKGGKHTGGLRLVGEQGPELEVTPPSIIVDAQTTESLGTGGLSGLKGSLNSKFFNSKVGKYLAETYDNTKATVAEQTGLSTEKGLGDNYGIAKKLVTDQYTDLKSKAETTTQGKYLSKLAADGKANFSNSALGVAIEEQLKSIEGKSLAELMPNSEARSAYLETLKTGILKVGTKISELGSTTLANPGLNTPVAGSSLVEQTLSDIRGSLMGDDQRTLYTEISESRETGSYPTAQQDADSHKINLLTAILANIQNLNVQGAGGDPKSLLDIRNLGKATGGLLLKSSKALAAPILWGYKKLFSGVGKVFKGVLSIGSASKSTLLNTKNLVTDVYLKGETDPILKAEDLKNGLYIDGATGKVIDSIAKLNKARGDILRKDPETGKFELVAKLEDLQTGLFDRLGKKLPSMSNLAKLGGGLKNTLGGALRGGGLLASAVVAPWVYMGKLAKSGYNTLKNFVTDLPDVYVTGETTPRLLATVIRNGGYVDSITGKQIKALKDVKGDILDLKGNVVLSLDDMRNGLVDSKGRKIGFLNRQISRIKSVANLAGKVIGGGLDLAKRAVVGSFNAGRAVVGKGLDVASNLVSGLGLGFGMADPKIQEDQLTVLKDIRSILESANPKKGKHDLGGDGVRDGSWQERLANRKGQNAKASEANSGKSDSKDSKGGLLSGLAALFKGKDSGAQDDTSATEAGLMGAAGAWMATKAGAAVAAAKGMVGGAAGLAARGALALVGVVSLPVLLTGAAIAATAVGGYLLYKHLTKRELGPLGKIRIMQYGFKPEDSEWVAKLYYLEAELIKYIIHSPEGLSLRVKEEDGIKIAKELGVSLDNPKEVEAYSNWLAYRFAPVYLAHRKALGLTDLKDFHKVDTLPAALKLEYLGIAKTPTVAPDTPHPYLVDRKPISGGYISIKARDINTLIASTYTELEKAKDSEAKEPKELSTKNLETKNKLNDAASLNNVVPIKTKARTTVLDRSVAPSGKSFGPSSNPSGTPDYRSAGGSLADYINEQNTNYHTDGPVIGPGTPGGTMSQLPMPTGDGTLAAHQQLFAEVSRITGVDAGTLATFAAIESDFNSKAKAETSSASGLFQFIKSTWDEMLAKYGDKYGIPKGTSPFDPRANTLLGAEFLKGNHDGLKPIKGDNVTETDLYLAHFMGLGGARTFLKQSPSANASQVFPAQARANSGIFMDGRTPKTIGGVYQHMENLVAKKGGNYAEQARAFAANYNPVPTEAESSVYDEIESSNVQRESFTPPEVTPPVAVAPTVVAPASPMKPTPTPTQILSNPVSIDNSQAIKVPTEQPSASVDEVKQRKVNNVTAANIQDREVTKQTVNEMHNVAGILNESLQVQRAMNANLIAVVELLKAGNSNPIVEEKKVQKPDPKVTRASLAGAKEVSPSILDLSRRKTI